MLRHCWSPRTQVIEKLYQDTSVVGPDHIFRALARHGMVQENKALFRAGPPLATAGDAPSATVAAGMGLMDSPQQMHVVNIYKLGEEVAGHKVSHNCQGW